MPLENEQEKLKKSLEKVTSKITTVGNELSRVDDRVAALRKTFEETTTEAAKLKIELEKAEEIMGSAQNLVGKLENEFHRWNRQVGELQKQLDQLPKLALLSAAFVTYLSLKPEDERAEYLKEWTVKLGVDKFDLRRFLCTESELLTWKAEGLPSDQLSVENSIVILEVLIIFINWGSKKMSSQFLKINKSLDSVLLIDPSNRASDWLKKHMAKNKLEVINQQVTCFGTRKNKIY